MPVKRLLVIFGGALVVLALLAWAQGGQFGYPGGAPVSAVAADPKEEACQGVPCGQFGLQELPCADQGNCGKLLELDIQRGPCDGPCRPVDLNAAEGPCNGPCRPVNNNLQPCRGPCRELDLPVSPPGHSGLEVPPGLRQGH